MVTALLLTLLAQARERWVDPVGGDDARDGTRERPWRTLAKAVADLRGGDTLHLVPGPEPFREPLLIKDRRLGGSPERPTVI
ncbi:MAG TPA: DUF1565 domain-containing protein, partial [Planctomycetota bacterium]|nr:DUF1565 domain-containing protein [Planctomycetota bacterium]